MRDLIKNEYALVGIVIDNTVFYSVVDNDGDFENTGRSIINFLKNNKTKFLSMFFKSQAFNGIKYIFDDTFVYNEKYDPNNLNTDTFSNLSLFIIREYKNIYLYNTQNDVLIVNSNNKLIALDYNNPNDVEKYSAEVI